MIVTDARGSSAADAAAIAAGIPSRALMQRAGASAATQIAFRYSDNLVRGVVIATGAGNNGGDGWVIARSLHAVGIRVRVVECAPARSPDAVAERALALADGVPQHSEWSALSAGPENIVVDALLGTGYSADQPLRAPISDAIAAIDAMRARGVHVVAIDVPSGLDASTGAHGDIARAELTLTFGTVKRGQLVARGACGVIVVLDIGLGVHARAAGDTQLATPEWFHDTLPRISADAHKGTRGKVAIVGGGAGMAGASILAARGALRSGAGMVKCVVAPESLRAVQEGEPAALAAAWPESDNAFAEHVGRWADALLIGPGLGRADARALVERALRVFHGPVVLDADALNAFEGDAGALAPLLGSRAALLTPHPAEFARLAECSVEQVLAERFDAPARLAKRTGAAVLLKGVPTVVASPDGRVFVVAEGTPVLATGGSGDVLGGIAAALLGQVADACTAGALAAFAHGRGAASVSARHVRGYTLDDVLLALPDVWASPISARRPPILAELPAVGE
jgi:NAD(P)H-hydrate epimerase